MAWDGLAAAVWWAHGTVAVLSPWRSMGRLRTEEPHISAWGQILHSPQAEHGSSRHSERRSCPVQCGLGIEDPFNADVSPSRAQRCSETSIWAPPREVWTSCCSDKRVRSLTLCTSEIHIPFQVSLFMDASWKLLSNPHGGLCTRSCAGRPASASPGFHGPFPGVAGGHTGGKGSVGAGHLRAWRSQVTLCPCHRSFLRTGCGPGTKLALTTGLMLALGCFETF